MDLDELQSVQSRERQTDSLQQLRATFYRDAAEFINSLEAEREEAAQRADDPWNSPEVGRLNDDIDTAEGTVEAIYERRVGKIVKMASLAAADMPTEDDGLTDEERSLFETLVNAIEENREHVFAILDGEDPADGTADADPDAPAEAEPPFETAEATPETGADERPAERESQVDAADLMAGDSGGETPSESPDDTGSAGEAGPDSSDGRRGTDSPDEKSSDRETTRGPAQRESGPDQSGPDPDEIRAGGADTDTALAGDATGEGQGAVSESTGDRDAAPAIERTTVKITSDVGEIFGVDERAYDLSADDVVTLPEANAAPLLDSDAAERLE